MILTKEEISHALADYLRISRASAMILIESMKVMVDAVDHGRREGIYFPKDTPQPIQDSILRGYATVEAKDLQKIIHKKIKEVKAPTLAGEDLKKIFEILTKEQEHKISFSALRLKTLVPGYSMAQYSNAIGRFLRISAGGLGAHK